MAGPRNHRPTAGYAETGKSCLPTSSTSRVDLALAALATATRRGEVAALIDLEDALDPASLLAVGADLSRVLWVRPGSIASSAGSTKDLNPARRRRSTRIDTPS